ncbi:MAG: apolipoprotein N-acyltransferase, partial [Mycobacteriales bacterium]
LSGPFRIRNVTTAVAIGVPMTIALSIFAVGLLSAALTPVSPASSARSEDSRVTIALVQGNVPRAGLDFNAQRQAVLNNHAEQTQLLAARVARGEVPRPDVVIWPENSSDIDPYTDKQAAAVISAAARAIGVPLLIGAVLDGPGNTIRNAGIVWDPVTGPGERYIKRHPVPFAEYIPHRTFFRQITDKVDLVRRDFAAGDRPGVMQLGPVAIGDVICFEVAYDDITADVMTDDTQLFVVQTNNATFGKSAQSSQQLAMVRLRAVEHGRFAVMASTTGISAIVSPRGTLLESTELFTAQVLLREVQLSVSRTLATTVGAWPERVLSLLAAFVVVVVCVLSRTATRAAARSPKGSLPHTTPRTSGGDVMTSAGQTTTVATTQTSEFSNSIRGQSRILVIVPTFNEADNIEQITSRLRTAVPDVAMLIADDNSPDGTGAIADRLADSDESVHVLHRKGKEGLGAAYIAGFDWAREHGYDVVVEMDADGSHAPEQLPALLAALDDADLVIGSRWVPGGEIRNWPRRRQLLSRLGNLYTRLALGLPFGDATGGFRVYRRQVLDAIDWSGVASQGYCFQVDLTWRTYQAGFRITEVPITFTEREQGTSKMSMRIVVEAWWLVLVWGVRARVRRARAAVSRVLRRS